MFWTNRSTSKVATFRMVMYQALAVSVVPLATCSSSAATSYDANQDFSLASNPNGVWSYGAVPEIGGPFTPLAATHVQPAANGVEVQSWELVPYSEPAVFCNTSAQTAIAGPGTYPPGVIWFFAGYPGSGHNLGAIRFTLPAGEAGNYKIEAAVQHYLDGPPAGDTDFHVAKNTSELFGQFMAPGDRSGYTNTLALVPGDTIDFLVGRGADDELYGSGLKITARIRRTDETNLPPLILSQPQSQTVAVGASVTFTVVAEGTGPLEYQWRHDGEEVANATNTTLTLDNVQSTDAGKYSVRVSNSFGSVPSGEAMLKVITLPPIGSYDLSRDFSATDNPGGAWSFGWSDSVGGPFTLLTVPHTSWANGVSVPSWQLTSFQTPAVYQNNSTSTVSIAQGQGVFPPGAVWYYPGEDDRSENFGVIRFAIPPGAAGVYRLETAVRSVYDGALSRDADFHVVKNGAEIFNHFLPPNSEAGYTNLLALSVSDTIDFVIGRGEDGSQYASGLKIHATLHLDGAVTEVPPLITAQPRSQSVLAGVSVMFSVAVEGTPPFTYQWRLDGIDLVDATDASLTLENLQAADAGSYSVRVSNPVGASLSANATLTVEPTDAPPSISQQPAGRVATPGETVILTVEASGTPPMSYQWRWEGMDLPNANSDRLVLSSVSLTNAGLYSVVVSNPFGTATSADALLTVNDYGVSGSVIFANRSGGLNAPIFDVDGVTKLSGPGFRAQLYAGATIAGLAPVGPSVGFSSGGIFFGGTRNIPGVAPGLSAYIQVRVWDGLSGTNYDLALSASGKTGASEIFSVVTGGAGSPPSFPAILMGLQSFSLMQMQLVAASSLVAPVIRPGTPLPDGTPTWLLTGQMGSSYVVECSTDLHAWLPLVTVFNPSGTVEFTDPAFARTPCTYYRARLAE
jgi:Immunoglobulin domain